MRLISLLLLMLCLASGANAASENDKKATESQIHQLKQEIDQLQKDISARQSRQSSLQASLRKSEKAIGQVNQSLDAIERELDGLETDLSSINKRKRTLEASIEKNRTHIASLIQEEYKKGAQPRLKMLLSGRDPEQSERMLRYYDEVNKTLADQLRSYSRQIGALESTQKQAKQASAAIVQKREQLQKQIASLESAQSERKSALSKLSAQQRSDKSRLSGLQADQAQLNSVLKKIQASIAAERLTAEEQQKQRFSTTKGDLNWPVAGDLIRKFGQKINGVAYDGILIRANSGSSVTAVQGGRVVFSDWLRGYGLLLIIDHGDGYMSLYGHNSSLLRDTGTWVRAGEKVATVGNSGGYDTTGLYFAIRHKGQSTDPVRWLKRHK